MLGLCLFIYKWRSWDWDRESEEIENRKGTWERGRIFNGSLSRKVMCQIVCEVNAVWIISQLHLTRHFALGFGRTILQDLRHAWYSRSTTWNSPSKVLPSNLCHHSRSWIVVHWYQISLIYQAMKQFRLDFFWLSSPCIPPPDEPDTGLLNPSCRLRASFSDKI